MGTTHEQIILRNNNTGAVLMYFPMTSTAERTIKSNLIKGARQWDKGGGIAIDKKLFQIEFVLQGTFLSTDETGMDADYVTDLRTLMGVPAGTITANDIDNYLAEQITTVAEFRLDYLDSSYQYSAANVDISDGKWPPVAIDEYRIIGEGSKDRLDFVLRMTVGHPEV